MLAFGQSADWIKTFNNPLYPYATNLGEGLYETDDGGLLITGMSSWLTWDSISGSSSGWQFLIIKTDEFGNEININLYSDGIGHTSGPFRVSSDTLVVVGTKRSNLIHILGINQAGDSLLCDSVIIDSGRLSNKAASAFTNDGYIITASDLEYSPTDLDTMLIIKYSIFGEILWQRKYVTPLKPTCVYPTQDNGYLVALGIYSGTEVMKIDSLGEILWTVPYSSMGMININSIIETNPNEFLCIGNSDPIRIGVCAIIDSGHVLWSRNWMFDALNPSYVDVYSLIPTSDGNFAFCGYTGMTGGGTIHLTDGFIMTIDSLANVLWQTRVDIAGRCDRFYSVIQTRDSGFVATGEGSLNEIDTVVISLVKVSYDGSVVWENDIKLPQQLSLSAHPNPFNSAVSITAPEGAEIEIFDVSGRRIDVIASSDHSVIARSPMDDEAISSNQGDCFGLRPRNDGKGVFIWQPDENIPSGVYLVRATASSRQTAAQRVVYLK